MFAHKDIAQPTSGSCSQILPSLGQTPTEIYGHKEQAKQKEQANKFLKSQLFIHSRCMTVDVSENLDRIESTILLSFKKKKEQEGHDRREFAYVLGDHISHLMA